MRPDQLELLVDSRLTDQARILGLWISEKCVDEAQEVSHDELATLLKGTSVSRTVSRHIRLLTVFGYVENSPGGRGHANSYLWIAGQNRQGNGIAGQICLVKPVKPDKNVGVNGTVVVGSSLEVVEENAGARDLDLNVENLAPLALRALDTHQELLRGCRGALRDYLLTRVPPDRQYPYVQSIAGWLNDLDPSVWRLHDGSHLPQDERPSMLAVSLNELMATDETVMKRPVGEPANLRTKLQVLLRKRQPPSWAGSGMTAAEERDREASRRNRALERSRQAKAEAAEREIDEKVEALNAELREAETWFGDQHEDLQEEIRARAKERIQVLLDAGAPKTKMFEASCLQEEIRTRWRKQNCAIAQDPLHAVSLNDGDS